MNTSSDAIYASKKEALKAGVPENDVVLMHGTEQAIIKVSEAIKADRRRKAKAARKSRKKNRS